MYQGNLLRQPGGIEIDGVPIDLRRIKIPVYILATREDHIAPWKSTFAATQLYGGPIKFVLSASGHIAGVVNPPAGGKYCYWVNNKKAKTPDEWFQGTQQREGSWWPDWQDWIEKLSNKRVKARQPGGGKLKPLAPAPGTYVAARLL
jgi:polyhydroxyalkanoate synthase